MKKCFFCSAVHRRVKYDVFLTSNHFRRFSVYPGWYHWYVQRAVRAGGAWPDTECGGAPPRSRRGGRRRGRSRPWLQGYILRVADPGRLSRILIFTLLGSRIQKQLQKERWKKISCHTFFYSHKFNKIVNYFIFEMLKKKILANFQRIM